VPVITEDMNGKNISGPPPAPLAPYAVKIVKDEVIILQKEA
jgi:Rieske Fe-S protein